ncbi:MAG TPA: imidazole glycerol phosphate synthase subunit HisH [Chthoniobacterales bacterium]|nr:imidazole glycerol phosphate synthase subunit HisH [Chthoniobacterales bacterium]
MNLGPRLGLIDYGSGNLRSVSKALEAAGASITRLQQGPIAGGFDAVVLPGVGAFGDSVNQLKSRDLFVPLQEWLNDGRHFLGVCLGFQLLFESSEESPGVAGLGIFEGQVRKFSQEKVKVPQIGWNSVTWTEPARTLYANLPADPYFYFVHSYYPQPKDDSIVACYTEYGDKFAAAVATKNLLATQFHPEKSQESGLLLLRQFLDTL